MIASWETWASACLTARDRGRDCSWSANTGQASQVNGLLQPCACSARILFDRKGPLAYEQAHTPAFGQLDTWNVPTSLTRTAIVRGRHTLSRTPGPTSPDFHVEWMRAPGAVAWQEASATLQVGVVHSWLPWLASSNISTWFTSAQRLPCPVALTLPFPCCCIKGRSAAFALVRSCVVLVCASEAFVWTPWLRHGKSWHNVQLGPAQRLRASFWCGSRDTLDMSLTRLYHFGTRFCWAGPPYSAQLLWDGLASRWIMPDAFSGAFETTPRTDRMVLTTAPKLARARAWSYPALGGEVLETTQQKGPLGRSLRHYCR